MKNPLLNTHLLLNLVILIVSGIISSFTLLFGLAHLYEGISQIIKGNGPNISIGEALLGWFVVIFLCIIGITTLVIAIASIQGIINKVKKSRF